MASDPSTLLRRRGALPQASRTRGSALFVATVLVGHVIALNDVCLLPESFELRARAVPRVTRRRKCALGGKTKGIGAKAAAAACVAMSIPTHITPLIIAFYPSLASFKAKGIGPGRAMVRGYEQRQYEHTRASAVKYHAQEEAGQEEVSVRRDRAVVHACVPHCGACARAGSRVCSAVSGSGAG